MRFLKAEAPVADAALGNGPQAGEALPIGLVIVWVIAGKLGWGLPKLRSWRVFGEKAPREVIGEG